MQFICLANSRKLGGRCIAGIDIDTRRWVRPISHGTSGEFNQTALQYDLGGTVEVLDVLTFSTKQLQKRSLYHPEDVLHVGDWSFLRYADPNDSAILQEFVTTGPLLLGSKGDSVVEPLFESQAIKQSLTLVRPKSPLLSLELRYGKKQYRCRFSLSSETYDLSITDPVVRARMRGLDLGEYTAEELGLAKKPFLTISLGEPYEKTGRCYKLVAAAFPFLE
jgi:hypothetical protein